MALKDFALGGNVLVSEKDTPKFVLLQRTIDFGVTANSVVTGDTVQCLNIPAGFLVAGASVEIQTIEATTSAQGTLVELGDGTDPNGYLSTGQCDLSTIATNICNSTSAYGALNGYRGKHYTAADTIDLFPKGTLNAAKVRVGVWGFMIDPGNDTAFGLDGDSA